MDQDDTIGRPNDLQTGNAVAGADTSPIAQANRHLPRIDGYVIQGKLGQGGMGVVYRALQVKLNRVVALKVLPAVVADKAAISRFRREAMAAARLHHTNIVPIYDFGESHDSHFYAMELIEGRPLNDCITSFAAANIAAASPPQLASAIQQTSPVTQVRAEPHRSDSSSSSVSTSSAGRGRVYFRQVAQWTADAADALHYAHGQGIIHRDIKPGNMILCNDGRLMITDFGLAKTTDDTSISVVGALLGAIRYVSPEQSMAGRVKVDHRTDIWSLGTTLYELLTFVPAFRGTDQNQILSAIISKDPVAPRKLSGQIPQELETICLKCLEKDPDHRYATARALAEDLRRWLGDLPIEAKRAGPVRRVLKFAKRQKAVSTAVISVILIAALCIGFIETRRAWQLQRFLDRGALFEREGNWAGAERVYRAAFEFDSQSPAVLINLARSIQEQLDRKPYTVDMVQEPLALCEKARALKPDHPNIDNTFGVLLSMARRSDEAVTIFKGYMPVEAPAHVWSNIAAVHYLSEHDAEALDALNRSIENPKVLKKLENGKFEPRGYFHGYHELATFQLLHRNPEALATVEKGIDLQPENEKHFAYYLVKARILLTMPSLQDPVRANAAAEAAKGLYHNVNPDPYVERYLALSLLRLGQVERARRAIERAKEAEDLPVFIHLLRGLAEAKAGDADAAKAALEEADRCWPAELKEPRATTRSRHLGMIWFESADELYALHHEAESFQNDPTK